ncbi:uncharacterized protein LOC128392581 [Panonychus citri]|uniref:uncharacterized protein LOC128392581 n=1 Tax=Panonychus citri TaxID=50023 RepID=UPI0023076309|nr:uncharacterized protein LOC128392581 [Panonychus citri]
MVFPFPLILRRNLLDSRVSVFRSIKIFSSLNFDRIKFDQRCFKSTNSSENYIWNYVKTPTENAVLFVNLIEDDGLKVPKVGIDNGQKFPDKNSLKELEKKSVDQLYTQIIDLIKLGNSDCLGQISRLLRANFNCLNSLVAPFDSHWQFIKKLDSHLVNYCKRVNRGDWLKSKFIDDCLQLTIDLYKFSPPTVILYCDTLVKNILGKVNLTKRQFLQLMFCCVLSRQQMVNQQVDWCQRFIDQHLNELSLAELSLILVAFHKTRTYIVDDKLYKKIVTKVSIEAKTERDATLRSSLLKGVNYSLIRADIKSAENLVNSFLEVDNLSVYNLIHLNEFCVKQKFYSPKLINKSINMLENVIEHLRIKDIERILKCATAFDHLQPPCPNIDRIVNQLDSVIDQSGPIDLEKTIPSLLRSVFLLDIYPPNMINFILSKDWLKKLNFYGPDIHLHYWLLMTIRDCLMIERNADYKEKSQNLDQVYSKGIHVNKLRVPIGSITNNMESKMSMNNRNLNLLYKATIDAFPDRIVQFGYFLSTSLTPDLMLTTEPKHLRLLKGPIRAPNTFIKAYVIVYQGKQMYIDQNYCQISGHYRLRERLLQKLGLNVVNIPFYEIYHKTDEFGNNHDLVDYIKRRINQLEQ